MEQPIFPSRSVATSLTVKNGSTILMAGGMNSKDEDKEVIYVFVTARTVDGEGAPTK